MKTITALLLALGCLAVAPLFSQTAPPAPQRGEKGATPLATPPSGGGGEVRAVVIGISDYQDSGIPDLHFADRDALAFANFLRSPAGGALDGDHLKVLTNDQATLGQIAAALDWLLEVAQEGDHAIIYFSGHGDVENKRLSQPGYLLGWDAPARNYMAGGAVNVRDFQQSDSLEHYARKALEANPNWTLPCIEAAYWLLGEQPERARPFLELATKIDSSSAELWDIWALFNERQNNSAEAERQLKKSIALDSTYTGAWNNLGHLYVQTHRYTEAELVWKKCLSLDSTNLPFWNNLGYLFVQTRRYAEAEQQYKKAIQLDSTLAEAYYNLSCIQSLQNQTEAAFDYLEKALKNGYKDYDWMQQDTDLAPLRENQEQWKALMKKHFPDKVKD